MKKILALFILFFAISCAPNGVEKDIIRHENDKMSLPKSILGTERYYIDRAIEIGALDKDSIGEYTIAIQYLDSALLINPSNMKAYRLKAYATSLLGDNEKALDIIEDAIKINANDSENYLTRAGLLIGLERKSEGLENYYKAIKIDSNNSRAIEAIGYMEIEKGNKLLGCEYLKKARDLGYLPENRESDKYLCK